MRLHTNAASANCLKVRCLLSLLDLECEFVEVDIFAGDTLTDAFAQLNPVRETPVLETGDGEVITQSGAILAYLAEGTPWAGATRAQRAQALAWLHFEQERVMAGIGGPRFRLQTGRATAEELAPRIATGRAALDVLEAHLTDREWLVGDAPTIADVGVWAYAQLADQVGLPLREWPAVSAWIARLRALPGFVDAQPAYPAHAQARASRSIYD